MMETIRTVNTRHDIGLVASARLIAILWAGTIPIVVPAWLIIKSEMVAMNTAQDQSISLHYVSRGEFEDRMKLLDERAQRNTDTLKEIRDEQKEQRNMLEQISQKGKR